MSRRMIRVEIELFVTEDSTDYVDLPDGWDDLSPEEQQSWLDSMAEDTLSNVVSTSATVVEVDEDGAS